MAKKNVATETTEKQSAALVTFNPAELPADFANAVDVGLDRFLYKPESCGEVALIGYLIGTQEFNRDKDKKEWWDALIVKTTQVTKVVSKDDDGEEVVVECPVGEEVMIPVTGKLEKLIAHATHPTQMAEFYIKPIDKMILERDAKGEVKKSMWRYKVVHKEPVDKVGIAFGPRASSPAITAGASLGS